MWPFRKAAAETRASLENPSVPLSDVNAWRTLMGEWHGVAGVVVTHETALEVPAVWCAVNFIANTIASLPLQVFKKSGEGRDTVESDPLYGILHDAPNDELTSFMWRKGMMINVLLRGRGVSFIERNKAGRVMSIWPLDTDKLTIERKSGRKLYHYDDGGRKVTYAANEVLDLTFMLKPDGVSHVDPISKLKGAVGLALALDEYARKFFANGGVPPLALYGPMPSPAAASRASQDVEKAVRDANAERRNVMIMPTGHELKAVGVDPEKSQMVESRRLGIEEIARIYGIPPVFLQDLTHGTFSNTEQQDLALTKHLISQWVKAWEQELNLKLFSARNRTKFVEFNLDSLMRGDFRTRMEGYAKGIQNGIYTPDEVRAMENWPSKGGDADKLHIQGATVPLGMQSTAARQPANDNNPDDEAQAA
ncbi:phage portal protein [Sinorhizobium medicae]|uniref:phage portal protein n=2 Tax=Sinorhizobium/Ensifer group TaxID=227292 RepID=UPI000C79DC23|nr:phage portal protein [Sinorhizobium meliloti]MDX0426857.1 phage portal protein [Sinorhizobium medicae]TWB03170.1 HK97 family phage portal protein [Ensifer sp. SEMIA 134]TWB39512.1 HK97 family phage portal protein [Ensifer sp. SEMIA 135]PLU02331.1 phage portal protein [Sinorhizobium medicae]PLU64530.1 phage portal protein [Sinorhizobium medicae]